MTTVTVRQAEKDFATTLRRVTSGHEAVILRRGRRAVAVLVPADEYLPAKDEDIPATRVPQRFMETRLVVYGELLSESNNPKQSGGKWYLPVYEIKQNFGFSLKNDELKNILRQFDGKGYISADDLKIKIGITYRYDESMNMLMFSKDE